MSVMADIIPPYTADAKNKPYAQTADDSFLSENASSAFVSLTNSGKNRNSTPSCDTNKINITPAKQTVVVLNDLMANLHSKSVIYDTNVYTYGYNL
jgi:hypothetical protein